MKFKGILGNKGTYQLISHKGEKVKFTNSSVGQTSSRRNNIHMHRYMQRKAQHSYVPLLSLRRDSPSKIVLTFSVRPCSSVGRVTVDLIRRSWVRFPPRSKEFFFASCGFLFPFARANAQWVIHGFK